MKKLIITGVSSFIGFHLANFFSKEYKLYGTITKKVDNYSGIQKIRLNKLISKITFIENFNLTNHNIIDKTISKIKPDLFIQHAGWAKSYNSFDYDIKKGFEINVIPLSTIFQSLKKYGCEGIIITGSSFEYTDHNLSDNESDLCLPTLPYGFSKLSQSIFAHQLSVYYNLPTRLARIYIPFGPYDSPNKLIPYVFDKLYNNKIAELTSCYQKRDFIHIDDLLIMYEFLIKDLFNRNYEIYNCASGKLIELRSLLNIIINTIGRSKKLLNFSKKKEIYDEPLSSFANISKFKNAYSSGLDIDINKSIKKYYEFIKKHN